ncbi:MAG: hypothetical protein ACO31I_11245 [Prochlorotrichaceae cyanobacterium]|jgi:hypothetical protein
MFQWVTIILAVFAAGALLVGADQVVRYFQTREPGEVPVENQLNPSPSPGEGVPSPTTAAGTSPSAQTFDSRFPGSNTGSPGAPLTEATAAPEAAQTFNSPLVSEGDPFASPDDINTPDLNATESTIESEDTAESNNDEGIRALW